MAKLTEYKLSDVIGYGTITTHLSEEDAIKDIALEISNLAVPISGKLVAAVHYADVAKRHYPDPEDSYRILVGMRANIRDNGDGGSDEYLGMLIAEIEELLQIKKASVLTVEKEVIGGRFRDGQGVTNGHP